MAACHSMEKHSVDVFIFIFFIQCFHKKITCFHSMSFFIPFHSEYSHIVTSTNIDKRYTFVLWKADLLAWKKRYGCEVGNPVGNPKLRSPWVATLLRLLRLLRLLH